MRKFNPSGIRHYSEKLYCNERSVSTTMKKQLRIGLTTAFLLCCMCLLSLAAAASAPKTTEQVIDENLDILISEPYQYFSEQEMIHAHPDAYQNILDLGEEAVPYLRKLAGKGSHLGFNRTWDEIARESMANYLLAMGDFSYKTIKLPSPNQQYILHMHPVSFMDSHDDTVGIQYAPYLESVQTGELTSIDPDRQLYFTESMNNINRPIWSDDSRYILFSEQFHFQIQKVYVYDVENAEFFALPAEEEIEALLGRDMNTITVKDDKIVQTDCNYPRFVFHGWDGGTVRIDIVLQNWNYTKSVSAGYYVYDMQKREITDLSYTIDEDSPRTLCIAPQTNECQPKHLSLLVRRDLEALIESVQPEDTELDMIMRHPEEHTSILNYNEYAINYLREAALRGIGDTQLQKSASRVMAYSLLSIKNRDYFVTQSVSPNKKYILEAVPVAFYDTKDQGIIAEYKIYINGDTYLTSNDTYSIPYEYYHDFRVTWSKNSQYVTAVPVNINNVTIPGNDKTILFDVLGAEYSYPTDMDAVRTLFETEGADMMLDRSPADYLHTQEEVRAFIDACMTEILDKSETITSTKEMLAAAPKAYAKLLWLGKDTLLPHLWQIEYENQEQAKKGDTQSKRLAVLSLAVQYTLQPERFNLHFTSPDKSYTVSFYDCDFYDYFDENKRTAYQGMEFSRNDSATYDYDIVAKYPVETYYNPEIWFSPNSEYFTLRSGIYNKEVTAQLFDKQNFNQLPLTTNADIDQLIKENNPIYNKFTCICQNISFGHWTNNNRVLLYFWYQYQDKNENLWAAYGYYLYDLSTQELVRVKFNHFNRK